MKPTGTETIAPSTSSSTKSNMRDSALKRAPTRRSFAAQLRCAAQASRACPRPYSSQLNGIPLIGDCRKRSSIFLSIELFGALFGEDDTVTLEDFNHKVLGKVCEAHRDSLKADYKQNDFVTNGGLNFPTIAI
jgi:hypothetical protein